MATKTRLDRQGRVVIPAEFRKALGMKEGDEVTLSIDDGGIRISTLDAGISRAQALVRQYIPRDRSLVDELIAERRAEAERE